MLVTDFVFSGLPAFCIDRKRFDIDSEEESDLRGGQMESHRWGSDELGKGSTDVILSLSGRRRG